MVIASLIIINIFWELPLLLLRGICPAGHLDIVTLRFVLSTPMIIAATLLLKGKQGLSIDLKDVPYMAFLATIASQLHFSFRRGRWNIQQSPISQ
jgi:hypothetical protein